MAGSIPRDDNRIPVGEYILTEKTITFNGATTDAVGDEGGALDPFTIFDVVGTISCKLLAICTVSLAGASATLEIGTALTTNGLIAQTTGEDIDANDIWHDATPDASVEAATVLVEKVVSQDIIGTVGTADITAGAIKFILLWKPLTADADVTPSTV